MAAMLAKAANVFKLAPLITFEPLTFLGPDEVFRSSISHSSRRHWEKARTIAEAKNWLHCRRWIFRQLWKACKKFNQIPIGCILFWDALVRSTLLLGAPYHGLYFSPLHAKTLLLILGCTTVACHLQGTNRVPPFESLYAIHCLLHLNVRPFASLTQ